MSLMVHSKLLTVLQAASESKSLVDNLSAPKAAFPSKKRLLGCEAQERTRKVEMLRIQFFRKYIQQIV